MSARWVLMLRGRNCRRTPQVRSRPQACPMTSDNRCCAVSREKWVINAQLRRVLRLGCQHLSIRIVLSNSSSILPIISVNRQ
jgi:hypothetical protein